MIAIISPAKSLDFDFEYEQEFTQSRHNKQIKQLIAVMKEKGIQDLQKLMDISENLAELNVERFKGFKSRHILGRSKPCVLAFQGDVYQGLKAVELDENGLQYAQNHLRILSGLYGLLRPLDLIQPYRLEMGTKLAFDDYKSLYDFWDDQITKSLQKDLKEQGDDILVNLASNEYFHAVKRKKLKAKIIDVEFKDFKNGEYKIISFFAKRARGLMSRYIIDNQIDDVENLKGFDVDGYHFHPETSEENKLSFYRG